jgi:hypothetical protein
MPSLNSPIITGDVSGGLHTTSVDKLKGNAVAATAPTTGQTLLWNGTAWAPATPSSGGGGGANGLTYYLNQSTDADAPVTNIPGTPKQLGRTGQTTQVDVTTGSLTPDTWTLVAGFVSEATPQDPATTLIPAGLWDFNVWALGVADQNHSNSIRLKAYIYNGTTLTALGTSAVQAIGATSQQYSVSMLVEQTTILATDRIYVAIEALATANGHTVTAQFGDNTPSHVHTSLGLIGGTGLWKNVAGVLQSPASLLVNADVDAAAAIAQSKIDGLTDALGAKAAQAQVDVYSTAGTFTWTKPANAKLVNVVVISGGGGGGSGRKAGIAAQASGGGGGGGGSYSFRDIAASLLNATELVTVGSGGTGGASVTANSTNGTIGVAGGNSSFGTWVQVNGGGGAGTATTASGPAGAGSSSRAMFPGGNGSAGGGGAGALTGGSNVNVSSAGGGAGGGLPASATVGFSGSAGGTALGSWFSGGTASGGTIGGNGASAPNVAAGFAASGSAGGGGGSSVTGNAGNGGNGGLYGGAGGGGGAALDNVGNSGAGGAGAQGIVIVTTYF